MVTVSKPILLDETGKDLASAIREQTEALANAMASIGRADAYTKAEVDAIASAKLPIAEVANQANKVPRFSADGHLVLPSGVELW